MPDHSYDDLTLDRFWDDLVDSGDTDAQLVDPERAAVVRGLHALAEAPVPGTARERVRQALLSSHESATIDPEHFASGAQLEVVLPLRPYVDKRVLTGLPGSQVMRYVALAAMLLLVLGGMIGSIRLLDRLRDDDPAMIQAPGAGPDSATPGDATERTLLEVTLPIDNIPTTDRPSTPFIYWSVPPGAQDSWAASEECCTDPRILYIVNGAYTVRADGPVRMIRAGGQPETVPAETELTLGPGDAITPSAGVTLDLSNSGSTPVSLLTWTFFDPEVPSYLAERPEAWPKSWVVLNYVGESKAPPIPTGSVRFLLRDVTLAAGATLAPPANLYMQLFLKPDVQSALIMENSDHAIVNQGSTQTTVFVVTLQPATEIIQEQTLLDAVLPEDQLRTTGRFNSIMGYYAVPPGSRDSWSGPTDNAPEPLVWHVLSGTYSVRAEQDLQVARAGDNGSTTVAAAGSEITLGPGDALVRPARAAMELENSGQEPVHLVVWTLGDINVQGPSLPPSWDGLPCYPGETSGKAPTGPTRLKLRLVTLEPESTLNAPPDAYVQQFLDLTQEAPNLGQKSDFSLINHGSKPATLYVVSLQPAETGSGTTPETDEQLAEFTVPAEAFTNPNPGGDRLSLVGAHMTIPAGTTTTWDSDTRDDYPGVEIEYILDGSVSVTSEGPVQVIRADGNGTPENLPAGAQVLLGPGDTLIHRLEHQVVWTTGDASAELIVGSAIANPRISNFVPEEWGHLEGKGTDNIGPVPTSPSVLRFRRVAMEPDEVVTFPPGFLKVSLIHGGGSGFLGEGSDGSITLMGAKETTIVYFFSIEPGDVSSVESDSGATGQSNETDEQLVEFTVPAEAFTNPNPGGDRLSLDAAHVTIPADTTTTWKIDSPASYPGPVVESILAGSVAFTSDGPAQLIRAGGDGTPEDLAPRAEITLMPGDSLTHRLQDRSVWTTGNASAKLVVGYVIATRITQHFLPDEWTHAEQWSRDNAGPAPTGPSVIRIRRITMEPDGILNFESDVLKVPVFEASGPGFLGERSDGSITLTGATEPTTIYVFSIEPADATSATSGPNMPAT